MGCAPNWHTALPLQASLACFNLPWPLRSLALLHNDASSQRMKRLMHRCVHCAQAADIFARVRAAFPGANVFVSTFDDYTRELVAAAPNLDLPVFTQEVGDTWIYGLPSAPSPTAVCTCMRQLVMGVSSTASRVVLRIGKASICAACSRCMHACSRCMHA